MSRPAIFAARFAADQYFHGLADHGGVAGGLNFALGILQNYQAAAFFFFGNWIVHGQAKEC